MKLFHLPILFCLLFALSPTVAQEITDTGWPIEERCLGEPTPPPDDWTFPGAILIKGYAGIHAVQAEWETPRVVANEYLQGGALSPDAHWYASPYGEVYITESYNTITTVNEIRVSSTAEDIQEYQIDIPGSAVFYGGTIGQIHWQQNTNLLFEARPNIPRQEMYLFNPFTDEIDDWDTPDNLLDKELDLSLMAFSPDGTQVAFSLPYQPTPDERDWRLYNLNERLTLATFFLPGFPSLFWKPDSSHFVAVVGDQSHSEFSPGVLSLFDDGESSDVVFNPNEDFQFSSTTASWSPDGRYFAFVTFPLYVSTERAFFRAYEPENELYIADTIDRKITRLCISVGEGIQWSPNSGELAFLTPDVDSNNLKGVLILDLEKNRLLRVAYQIAGEDDQVIGWRGD